MRQHILQTSENNIVLFTSWNWIFREAVNRERPLEPQVSTTSSQVKMASCSQIATIAFGVAGVSVIGYCIYFDRKRRSDPLFKQKLRESKFLWLATLLVPLP